MTRDPETEAWLRRWRFVRIMRSPADLVGRDLPGLLPEDILGNGGECRQQRAEPAKEDGR